MMMQGRAGTVWSSEAAGEPEQPEPDDAVNEEARVETDPTHRYSRFEQILGRGAFKTVYKGFDEDEGIEVAWNQVRVCELVSSKEERDRLFAEIRVLKQLKHRNIMTFHDSWYDSKNHCVNFITELFTSGTLRQYRKKHKHVDCEVLKRWAWQILCGLVYLHGHTPPIIHRDLKCDNIFINGSEGVVKIGDLGLATLLRARTAPQSVLGTPEFMAPELYEEEYDDRVDVYSFGMCLLELATLQYPYSECRNAAQIYRKVMQGTPPAGLSSVQSPELANFIRECIAPRPRRPKSRHLLKHPYFETIRQEKAALKANCELLAAPLVPTSEIAETPSGLSGTSRQSSGMPEWATDAHGQLVAVPEEADVLSADDVSGLRWSPPASVPVSEAGDVQSGNGLLEEAPASTQHSGQLSDVSSEDGIRSDDDGFIVTDSYTYSVKGEVDPNDSSKLLLRLKMKPTGADGKGQCIEFDYFNGKDTAVDLAREMVDDLNLSPEDAQAIVQAIAFKVARMTGVSQCVPEAPLGQDAPGPAAVDADMDVAGEPCTNGFATENGGCAPGPESNRFSPDSIGSALTSERQHDDFDMNAIYQTRKRSSSGVLSPVYHSDAKVPLRKLFENLEEVGGAPYSAMEVSAGSDLLGSAQSSELPPGPALHDSLHQTCSTMWSSSPLCSSSASLANTVDITYTQSAGELLTMADDTSSLANGTRDQGRTATFSLENGVSRSFLGTGLGLVCASAPSSRMLSRDTSPLHMPRHCGDINSVNEMDKSGSGSGSVRGRSKCPTAEERQLRQKEAADKLLKLENNCLLGFEVKGFGKASARMPPSAAPLRPRKVEGL